MLGLCIFANDSQKQTRMTSNSLIGSPAAAPETAGPSSDITRPAAGKLVHSVPAATRPACGILCHCPAVQCTCGLVAAPLAPAPSVAAPVTAPPLPRHSVRAARVDAVVTHPILGLVLFLGLMYLIFHLVQDVSAPYMDWVDAVIAGPVTHLVVAGLAALNAPAWVESLAVDGVIAGVGVELVLLPGLIIMYFALALLEEVGYLPRAATVMDGVARRMGLRGRSFLPMILGFGCNTPAIYATRSIESRPVRILTGLMIPFMSCSARLPIYVLFSLAFFPRYASWVIWGLYVLGILLALIMGAILSRFVFPNSETGARTTLPPYQRPSLRRLAATTTEQSLQYLKIAGTIVLAVSIVLWVLLHVPSSDPHQSLYGRASKALAPTLAPAGFGDWQVAGALVTGVIAKEMILSSMAQLTGARRPVAANAPVTLAGDVRTVVVGFGLATLAAGKQTLEVLTPGVTLFPRPRDTQDIGLTHALGKLFTPLAAMAFLVFVLTYIPCIPTLAAQAQQFGWRWAGVSVGVQTILPWMLAVAIYQGGKLLGLG